MTPESLGDWWDSRPRPGGAGRTHRGGWEGGPQASSLTPWQCVRRILAPPSRLPKGFWNKSCRGLAAWRPGPTVPPPIEATSARSLVLPRSLTNYPPFTNRIPPQALFYRPSRSIQEAIGKLGTWERSITPSITGSLVATGQPSTAPLHHYEYTSYRGAGPIMAPVPESRC